MNEVQRLKQSAAINTANDALADADLPSYDDLVDSLRDARALMNHANVPVTRSVQRMRDLIAAVDAVSDHRPAPDDLDG